MGEEVAIPDPNLDTWSAGAITNSERWRKNSFLGRHIHFLLRLNWKELSVMKGI